ncbi:hypothetical protein [Gracilimonas tropica]|uniref:hypothetical protein n=1 Tax=Gracilimonas tropica TaxID=454600 RepID=UPI00035E51F4|nr:hypothetical protein [Gracilimonas tropica]
MTKKKEETQKIVVNNDDKSLTANDILKYNQHLNAVGHLKPTNAKTAKFVHGVDRNLSKLSAIKRAIEKAQHDPDEEYLEYQNKRYQLAQECGAQERRLQNGTSEIVNIEDKVRFGRELRKLNEKYKKAIAAQEKIDRLNKEILQRVIDESIDWYMVDYKTIPAEVTAKQRANLSFMLNAPKDADFEEMDFVASKERE